MKRKLINVLSHSNGWTVEEQEGRLIFHHAPTEGKASLDSHFCTENYTSCKHNGGKTGPVICEFDSLEKNLLGLYCHAGGTPVKARQIARYEYDAIVMSGSRKVAESILKSTFNEEELDRLISLDWNPMDHDKIQVEITDTHYAFRYVYEGWTLSIGKGSFEKDDAARAYARLFQALFIRKVYGQDEIIRDCLEGLSAKEHIRMFGIYLTGIEPEPGDVLMPYGAQEITVKKKRSWQYRKYILPSRSADFYRIRRCIIWRGMNMLAVIRKDQSTTLFVMYRADMQALAELLGVRMEGESGREMLNRAVLEAGEKEMKAMLEANGTSVLAVRRKLARSEEECAAGILERYFQYLDPVTDDVLAEPSSLRRACVLLEKSGSGTCLYQTEEMKTGRGSGENGGSTAADYEEDLACIARFGIQ